LDLCVDVGCGNGQASSLLAAHFTRVVATDISESQIEVAKSADHPANVEFVTAPAEKLPAESGAVQLVCAFQACHWFDFPTFTKEVDRLLCNNGVLALCGYNIPHFVHPTKSEQLTRILLDFHHVALASYYGPGYKVLQNEYVDIPQPYKDCARKTIWDDEKSITLTFLLNEMVTTSGYQNFCAANGAVAGEELLNEFTKKVLATLDVSEHPDRVELKIKYKYFLIMGRKTMTK